MMCATCGCSSDDHSHSDDGRHAHDGHTHAHSHSHSERLVRLEHDVLAKNSLLATRNRRWFEHNGILALNLVSSPGSGKTTLLERLITSSGLAKKIFVIEGDQATDRDAERIRRAGARAVQVNTGAVCHLDASMVERALAELDPTPGSIVAIENVGNLVCPSLFDLGEARRVAILSVTEGDDKPVKYPHMFRGCQLVVLNKMDLARYVDFDLAACLGYVAEVNPAARVIQVSAKTGDGFTKLHGWIGAELSAAYARGSTAGPAS